MSRLQPTKYRHALGLFIILWLTHMVWAGAQASTSTESTRINIAENTRVNANYGVMSNHQSRTTRHYTGKKISLSLQEIDVRAALQNIADIVGINMVVADNVTGQITLQLDHIPWDQALDIILQSQGLGMRRVGNVINIAPLAWIAKREQTRTKAYQATHDPAPLQTQIIQIHYADADNIATLIQASKGPTPLLSKRGHLSVDPRTNRLVVTDTATNMHAIQRIIDQLDIPVRQVLIEARIVVANRGFSRELGVTQSVQDMGRTNAPKGSSTYNTQTGYTINLPVTNPAGIVATSIISNTFSLNLALSALESENRGEIISAPRVITIDGQQAIIQQGKEVPYTTQQGSDDPATTQFKKVLLNLTVTPHVTPNKHVLLEMALTQDNISGYTPTGEPVIDTRRVQTQVLVASGNTVVLGGIYQQRHSNSESQVPLLGDIPLLGPLFSRTQRQHEKLELLLFITPTILQATLTSR